MSYVRYDQDDVNWVTAELRANFPMLDMSRDVIVRLHDFDYMILVAWRKFDQHDTEHRAAVAMRHSTADTKQRDLSTLVLRATQAYRSFLKENDSHG